MAALWTGVRVTVHAGPVWFVPMFQLLVFSKSMKKKKKKMQIIANNTIIVIYKV